MNKQKRDGWFVVISRVILMMCSIFCARCACMQANTAGYFAATIMCIYATIDLSIIVCAALIAMIEKENFIELLGKMVE